MAATNYTSQQIKDYASQQGWLNSDGGFKDTDSALAYANAARKYGVNESQTDSAFNLGSGTSVRWLKENGVATLSQSKPPANTVSAPAQVWSPAASTAPSWAADPMSALQAAREAAGPAKGPTGISVSDDMLTSKQLQRLLSEDSPYIARARTSAAEFANGRGLLNSSIAAGAGEAAAIDSALPIAQGDAGVYFDSAKFSADAQNRFASDENAFNRTGALTAMQGGLDLNRDQIGYQFKSAESAADRSLQASLANQREVGLDNRTQAELDARDRLQMESQRFDAAQANEDRVVKNWMFDKELAARSSELAAGRTDNLAADYRQANQGAIASYNNLVEAIQASDMDPDVKVAQIQQAQATYQQTTQWLSTMYANAPGWQEEWATFSVEAEG